MKEKFWKQENWQSFWLAFLLTLLVMVPGVAAVWATAALRQEPTAREKTNIPIRLPDESHQMTLLTVITGEEPAFLLVRMDAVKERLTLAALPAQSVVRAGAENQTIGDCYLAAGPARVVRLLNETLGTSIDRYLAVTPEICQSILEDAGTVRIGLNGALTAEQRAAAGLAEDTESWTPESAHTFLQHLQEMPEQVPPPSAALARAVLWQGWARQKLDQLPRLIPEGLKKHSGQLLTDITGPDLLTMEQTLEFLADSQVQPAAGVVPGHWTLETKRYEFDEETLHWLQAFCNSEATMDASDSGKEP